MTIFEAIISGFIQGATEFLPVSSSGHLVLIHELFGLETESLSFDVALHLATLIAVVWVLRKEVIDVVRVMFSKKIFSSLGLKVIVATVPSVIFGLLLSDGSEFLLRSTKIVAFSMIFWGIVLYASDLIARKNKKLNLGLEKISWLQSVIVGIAQAIALIPGTSRSGITMTAGMFAGIDKVRVAKFSFLLSIPAILGAAVMSFIDVIDKGLDMTITPLIIGCLVALAFGILAIEFLLRFLQKGSFLWFAIYRVILGALILIIL
jgi:undecaprenyl-diphosphatase